jgi:hypothetical protein
MACCSPANRPKFPRNVPELLGQSLEDGAVTLACSRLTPTFPARFMLVAAMNPCPCRQQLTEPYHRRDGWKSESAKQLEEGDLRGYATDARESLARAGLGSVQILWERG